MSMDPISPSRISEVAHDHDMEDRSISQRRIESSESSLHGGARFVHQSLRLDCPSIRLVEVLAPSADGTIQCAIRHVTLDDSTASGGPCDLPVAGVYSCASYVWGPPDQTRWIMVNGQPFEVRQNLYDFLHAVSRNFPNYLDQENTERWYWSLWIDALCIDQENELERNHQVQQMGRIYSGATRVVAWLGANLAIGEMFEWLNQFEKRMTVGDQQEPRSYTIITDDAIQVFMRSSSGPQELYKNTYWRRAWVVQEVVLARTLVFLAQNTMTSSNAVRRLIAWLERSKAKEIQDLINHTKPTIYQGAPRIIENLELFHYKECSDVRDRIYSVLSVSRDGPQLPVNYDCSLVEIVCNTLRLDKSNICMQRVFVLLEALQINYTLDDVEACLPVIAQDGKATMRHAAPCAHCGEDTNIFSPRTHDSTSIEQRYICLHCNHSGSSFVPGTHRRRYLGHLCVRWDAAPNADNEDRHLFWMPAGGGRWHELQSYKYIVTNDAGTLKRLILSVGLLCELKALVTEKGQQGDKMQREPGFAPQSAPKSAWRVVK
jgi:hypothetical protein